MPKFNCPSCGADIFFKSKISVFAVCRYCHSTLVRHDLNLENLGKMAELPEDMSPFQLGTGGVYQGQGFDMVGRLKIAWEQGSWNEWFLLFSGNREGWLAEAQGFLMLSFGVDVSAAVPKLEEIQVGRSFSFPIGQNLESFEVQDIKQVTCVGSEGELPFSGAKGKKWTSVDLRGNQSRFASLGYFEEGSQLYIGEYVDFDAFQFKNLREIEGW